MVCLSNIDARNLGNFQLIWQVYHVGDFNDKLGVDDKKGDNPIPNIYFQEAVETWKLIDLPIYCYPYTWELKEIRELILG